MEDEEVVSVVSGVIYLLPGKLGIFDSGRVYDKLGNKEIRELDALEGHLLEMIDVFRKYTMMKAPDAVVREWMRQVREVAYDVEDSMDLWVYQTDDQRFARFIWRFSKLRFGGLPLSEASALRELSPGSSNHSGFGKQIRHLTKRLEQALEQRKRYKIAEPSSATGDSATVFRSIIRVDIDGPLIRMQRVVPVTIDGSLTELLKLIHLAEGTQTKVVSIVGMAGIGKTTLAMQAYRMLQKPFDIRAFVHVGPRPSILTVLLQIIGEVSQQKKPEDMSDEREAITRLREILRDKRYLVIIDDIWSISSWKAINCALPAYLGSCIILTTRFHDLAQSCCNHRPDSIYTVKILGVSDSIKLFHSRMFGSEHNICKEDCKDIHDSVLKICGGHPWTIISVASFLARRKPEEWKMIMKTDLSVLEKYPPSQRMSEMLHLSYSNLPLAIKSCFLYLSVFPENHMIDKNRLIWRWIAEGFICAPDLYDMGRSNFNELINRNLIHPVFADDGESEGDPVGCTVHGTVHDFIVSLSSEENFVTLEEELQSMPCDVIRRLSLNYKQEDSGNDFALDLDIMNLIQARSLTVLGRAKPMPGLVNFLLLRVLDLVDVVGLESSRLKDIGRMFNLRYLGLGGDSVTHLPEEIGNLKLLETLDIRRTKVRNLPPAAARLEKLARLLAEDLEGMPDGFREMEALEELSTVSVDSRRALSFLQDLGRLQRLKVLGVKWCFGDDTSSIQAKDFINSLNRLLNDIIFDNQIRSMSMYFDATADFLDFFANYWQPSWVVEKLELKSSTSYLPRIPVNVGRCYPRYLDIAVSLDNCGDLLVISKLQYLTTLKLSVKGGAIAIGQGFDSLKVFWFKRREGGLGLEFKEGAMPGLQKLRLHFKLLPQEKGQQEHGSSGFGLHHLCYLEQVHVIIDCDGALADDVKSMEAAIKKEIRKPMLKLSRENEENMIQDGGQESSVQEGIILRQAGA